MKNLSIYLDTSVINFLFAGYNEKINITTLAHQVPESVALIYRNGGSFCSGISRY